MSGQKAIFRFCELCDKCRLTTAEYIADKQHMMNICLGCYQKYKMHSNRLRGNGKTRYHWRTDKARYTGRR
jgi:hypothetical protein